MMGGRMGDDLEGQTEQGHASLLVDPAVKGLCGLLGD